MLNYATLFDTTKNQEQKNTILIVDDLSVNRKILSTPFQGEYMIAEAENGQEAIDYIATHSDSIGVILLDIIMPVMDGIEVLKWISANKYNHIPVIAVTADESYQLEALENGACDFLTKPVGDQIIKARVHNVVSRFALTRERKLSSALRRAKQEMDNLVNSIPGGIAVYKLDGYFDTLYFSDGVAALSGFSRDEYAEYIRGDATKIICEQDRARVLTNVMTAFETGAHIDETYRIYHKDGSLVWVHLNGALIEKQDDICIFHAVFQRPAKMAHLYNRIVNEAKSAIYVSDTKSYDLLYINEPGLKFIQKEDEQYSSKKCYEFLFNRTSPCPFCHINSMSHVDFFERDFSYPVNDHIYRMRGRLTDWNGIDAHIEYIDDVTEQSAVIKKNEELSNQLASVIEHVPGGMCLYLADKNGIHPLVHNQAFFSIFGYSKEKRSSVLFETSYLNVHPDDLAELKEKIAEAIRTSTPLQYTYRCFNDQKNDYIWIYLNAVVIDQADGSKLCYTSYTDVTEERRTHERLLEAQSNLKELQKQTEDTLKNYQTLVNTVPGGIVLYKIEDDKVKTTYYSDGLCALSGYTREERDQYNDDDAIRFTYEEDIPFLLQEIKQAIATKSNIDITYRIKTKSGTPRYVNLKATYSAGEDGSPEYHAVFLDVDEIKRLEKSKLEQQMRYEVAIKSSGINVWEYNIQEDLLTIISNSSRIKQNCYSIKNYIETTLANNYVRQDSIEAFYNVFDKLKKGAPEIQEDLWYRTPDGEGWWCERVSYTTVFDIHGKPLKAFGAGRDVTREKNAIAQFQDEMKYRTAVQGADSLSMKVNLTKNQIVEGESQIPMLAKLIEQGNADNYFAKAADYVIGTKSRSEYSKIFNRQALLHRFESEEYSASLEFSRVRDNGKPYWTKYSANLMKNPQDGDVVAFIIATDITDKKVMETVMQTITNTDYDFFVVVDGNSDTAQDYAAPAKSRMFSGNESFEKKITALIQQNVCPEDRARAIANTRTRHIINKIRNGSLYKFNYSVRNEKNEVRRKQLQFTMIDPERSLFLMTRIDVNEIFVEQQQSQKRLELALQDAKRAASAKSDFLSRMSHDIRTPLNAILGLANLGETESSPLSMKQYLKQIETSGEYLLSIINDVLDMSKIESKMLELRPEAVYLPDFLKETIAIVEPSIAANKISLEFTQQELAAPYVYLDTTYVKQVIVNLMSNAIKFTPSNGHVAFSFENISQQGTTVRERISVRDTGVGISSEFLPKIFLPFEQENSTNDVTRKGTGLGLSIVKSIVELMNGTISVQSQKDAGSTFVVELEFEVATASDTTEKKCLPILDLQHLKGHRILLCEDHPLNVQIAAKLLERQGMASDLAKNGQQAVEKFNSSAFGYYSAILMDIRMPIMDGLQATKIIRALQRPDAKTIPIIAMTANAFAEDIQKSLNSGMNDHLAKPFTPQQLYSTLHKNIFPPTNKDESKGNND